MVTEDWSDGTGTGAWEEDSFLADAGWLADYDLV